MTDKWSADRIRARSRVLSDNDYRGDPDGVVQLAHLLLCRSAHRIGERVDAWSQGIRMGETYSFGDVTLVTLVALGGCYAPEPIAG